MSFINTENHARADDGPEEPDTAASGAQTGSSGSEKAHSRAEDILGDLDTAFTLNRYGTGYLWCLPLIAAAWLSFPDIGPGQRFMYCALPIIGIVMKLGSRSKIRIAYTLTLRQNMLHQQRLHVAQQLPGWKKEKRGVLAAVSANVDVLLLRRGKASLLLLPDKVVFAKLRWDGKSTYGIMDFAELPIRFTFIHTYSTSWRYARKNGMRDRRYKNNALLRSERDDYAEVDVWPEFIREEGRVWVKNSPAQGMQALAASLSAAGFHVETAYQEMSSSEWYGRHGSY